MSKVMRKDREAEGRQTTTVQQTHTLPALIPSLLILMVRRWRQHLVMLLTTGLGLVVTVTFMCSALLYTQIAISNGLRSEINRAPDNGEVTIGLHPTSLSTTFVRQLQQAIDAQVQQTIGPYMVQGSEFTLQTDQFPVHTLTSPSTTFSFNGVNPAEAQSHLQLIQGNLPAPCNLATCSSKNDIEIALLPETAQALHAQIGSTYTVDMTFWTQAQAGQPTLVTWPLKLYVTGIFTIPQNDPYWHDFGFTPTATSTDTATNYQALINRDSFIAMLTTVAGQYGTKTTNTAQGVTLNWYYHPHTSHMSATQLSVLEQQLANLQATLNKQAVGSVHNVAPGEAISLQSSLLGAANAPGLLASFGDRLTLTVVAAMLLTLLIFCMLLLFITMATRLLVEKQADILEQWRSQGASRMWLFKALAVQGGLLNLVALLVGPLLALVVVTDIVTSTFSASDYNALNLISDDPRGTLVNLFICALITACLLLLVQCVVFYRASRSKKSSQPVMAQVVRTTFWRRLRLDEIATGVLLLLCAGAIYITYATPAEVRANSLLMLVITLSEPFLLASACLLLALRNFPHLLRFCERFALLDSPVKAPQVDEPAIPVPAQAVHTTFLILLATALLVFSQVCATSLETRINEMAAYQTGSDFRGVPLAAMQHKPIKDVRYAYSHIAGVISAAPGYATPAQSQLPLLNQGQTLAMELRAVDAEAYTSTAIWNPQNSTQSIDDLMRTLIGQRQSVQAQNSVPAIIDEGTASRLHLHNGSSFALKENNLAGNNNVITCNVVAIVHHIPTINDDNEQATTPGYIAPLGVLVDYQSLATFYQKNFALTPPVNIVWIHTYEDATTLTHVRAALQEPGLYLNQLYDRNDMNGQMHSNALYLEFVGLLNIGAISAMFLALIGALIITWRILRSRLTNPAAEGTQQKARVLLREQAALYSIAIFSGAMLGVIVSFIAIPGILYYAAPLNGISSGAYGGAFFIVQHALTAHIQVPTSLVTTVLAFIVLYCLVIIAMVRVIRTPIVQEKLRLYDEQARKQ